MRFKNLLWCFRGIRNKTNMAESISDLKISSFNKKLRRRFIHESYLDFEDNYRILARSTKVSYYALGLFLLIPSGLALSSPASSTFVNLLSHHFKVSSLTLSWISSTYLAFQLSKFGNTSFLANSRGFVGLVFTIVGVTGALVIGDYSLVSGFYSLLSSYGLLGFYNYILTSNQLLPRCIFIPSSFLILLNMATIVSSLVKSHVVRDELSQTSHEEIIRRFESSSLFKKQLDKAKENDKQD